VRLSPTRPIAGMLLILVLICLYTGARISAQHLAYTRAQTELSFWGRGSYQPTPQAIRNTDKTLQGLLQAAPRHPENLELQAHYTAWQAYWSKDLNTRDTLNREAVEIQYRALLSRPAHRQGWSKMVEYASRSSAGEMMLQLAQKKLKSLLPPGSEEGLH
jgi:hypothetical protein